jgi:hypothetical protein
MSFVSSVTLFSEGALPAQLTMRLWNDVGGFIPLEFASQTVAGPFPDNIATFTFPTLTEPLSAISVHEGTGDFPDSILRTGPIAQLPSGASDGALSVLFGAPGVITVAELQSMIAGVFAAGVLEFSVPVVQVGPVSVTLFVQVDSGSLVSLNPAAQTMALSVAGQAKLGEFGPWVGFTATFDVALSGSSDPMNPADIAALAVVPGSVNATFSAGSLFGDAEAAAANALSGVIGGAAGSSIGGKLGTAISAALPGVVVQALRANQAFATLVSLPPEVVISVSSVDVGAESISVGIALGQVGDVFGTLLAAAPPPQVLAACAPPLLREQVETARRFTVTATFQGTPVSCKVYYPTQADYIGLANTALDIVINGVETIVRDPDPTGGKVTVVTSYPDAYVVPDPATEHATVRCQLFEN